jgi:hypothetical protein
MFIFQRRLIGDAAARLIGSECTIGMGNRRLV